MRFKGLPLFLGTLLMVNRFEDSDSTKVIIRLNQMAEGPDPEAKNLLPVEEPVNVCYRFSGAKFLDDLAGRLNYEGHAKGDLATNVEYAFRRGSKILFRGYGPAEWNRSDYFQDEELLTMIKIDPETVMGVPSPKLRVMKTIAAGLDVAKRQEEPVESLNVEA